MTAGLKRRLDKLETRQDAARGICIRVIDDPNEPTPERPAGCEFFIVIRKNCNWQDGEPIGIGVWTMTVGLKRRLERLEEASGRPTPVFVFLSEGEEPPDAPEGVHLFAIGWLPTEGRLIE